MVDSRSAVDKSWLCSRCWGPRRGIIWMDGQVLETGQRFGLFRITEPRESLMVLQITCSFSLSHKPDAHKLSRASVRLFTETDLSRSSLQTREVPEPPRPTANKTRREAGRGSSRLCNTGTVPATLRPLQHRLSSARTSQTR